MNTRQPQPPAPNLGFDTPAHADPDHARRSFLRDVMREQGYASYNIPSVPEDIFEIPFDPEWGNIPTHDQKGHKIKLQADFMPMYGGIISKLVAGSSYFPNYAAFIRAAVHFFIHYLMHRKDTSPELRSVWAQLDAARHLIQEEDALAKFTQVIDSAKSTVAHHMSLGEVGRTRARKMILKVIHGPIAGISDPDWRKLLTDRFNDTFSDLINAGIVDFMEFDDRYVEESPDFFGHDWNPNE